MRLALKKAGGIGEADAKRKGTWFTIEADTMKNTKSENQPTHNTQKRELCYTKSNIFSRTSTDEKLDIATIKRLRILYAPLVARLEAEAMNMEVPD